MGIFSREAAGFCKDCGAPILNVEEWLLKATNGLWVCPDCFGTFRQELDMPLQKLKHSRRFRKRAA